MDEGTVTTQSRAQSYIIERPRLTKILDESEARIMLLCAPAGYGKTTLARQWVEGKEGVVWYSGGPAMADVAAFAAGIATVLAPDKGNAAADRIRRLASGGQTARGLAHAVAAASVGTACSLLVLDDYQHAMESDDSDEFFRALVELTPFRLLLTTRIRPRWVTSRMLVYGEALHIGAEVLTFSEDEVNTVVGSQMSSTTLASARGWPAVVGLAAMRGPSAQQAAAVEPAALYDFFADDLFAELSVALQEALFVFALAGDCDPSVAKALQGSRFNDVLSAASDRGFVTRGHDEVIAIHPLLRSFLLTKLREQDDAIVARVRRHVIAVLTEHREWDACLGALEALPEDGMIVSTLENARSDLLQSGQIGSLRRWLSLACQRGLADPQLLLTEAEVAIREGNGHGAETLGERAGRQLEGDDAARAYTVAARAAHLRGDGQGVRRWTQAASEAATSMDCKRDALWLAYTSANERPGERASELLEQLVALGSETPDYSLRLVNGQALRLHQTGAPREAALVCEQGFVLLNHAKDPFARTSFLNIAGGICVQVGKYSRAITVIEQLIDEARLYGLEFAFAHALVWQASALVGLRRLLEARSALDAVATTRGADEHVVGNARLQHAKLRIAHGDLDGAAVVLARGIEPGISRSTSDEFAAYRAMVDASRGLHVIVGLDELWFNDARALARLAIAASALQHAEKDAPQQARRALATALARGQADMVVTACRAFPGLAAVAASDPNVSDPLRDALLSSRDFDLGRRAGIEMPRELRSNEALSAREREVYEHLVAGRTNKQIARALFISESTTKVHVRHIFEKLGVHSRAEAAGLRLEKDV